MKFAEIKSTLTIPLYWTFHLENVEHFEGLSDRDLEDLRRDYPKEELEAMVEALAWAEAHPGEDYSSMLPGLDYPSDVLHRYLAVLHGQFEKEWGEWLRSEEGSGAADDSMDYNRNGRR